MILKLFILSLIIVFIIDISGAIDSLKRAVSYVLTKGRIRSAKFRLKPFDCSLCMIFWIGLIVLFFSNNFNIYYIGCVCLLACFSEVWKSSILMIEDIILKLIQLVYKNFIDDDTRDI